MSLLDIRKTVIQIEEVQKDMSKAVALAICGRPLHRTQKD